MTHELEGKTLAAYLRVSKGEQNTDRQRDGIEAWAKLNGLSIAAWFIDSQGKNPRDLPEKRSQFQALLREVEAGNVGAVVVDSQDRFGVADSWELGDYITRLRKHGCELFSVAQGLLSSDDDGPVIMATVGAMTSRREQKEKGHRSVGQRKRLAEQGEYAGGYPPYGCDVLCLDAEGRQKWRLVWVGRDARLRIDPDGTETAYDGKSNVPAHDRHDRLVLAPSVRTERVEAVRQMFAWYASEKISPARVATRLNEAKIDPVFSVAWEKQRVKALLMNPAFVGTPASNKRGQGRLREWVGGKEQDVPRFKGRAKAGRTRNKSDWFFPSELVFAPIVSPETFDLVQKKLQASSDLHAMPNKKASQVADFWLRNLVVCHKCGKPLRVGNNRRPTKDGESNYRSYYCSTYGTFGPKNPTGCGAHRVKAETLESIIDAYLAESHRQLLHLLDSDDTMPTLLASLEREAKGLRSDLFNLSFRRRQQELSYETAVYGTNVADAHAVLLASRFNDEPLDERTVRYLKASKDRTTKIRTYAQERREHVTATLADLEAKHETLFERVLSFDPEAKAAIAKANARLLETERKMADARRELEDLEGRETALLADLEARQAAIQEATRTGRSESAYRRKAQLASQVIDRIVCSYDTSKKKVAVAAVEVFPVGGESFRLYPEGNTPAPG